MTDSIDFDNSSTHSLNYGSDFKEVHCIQQQSVAKLSRSDLEDLYYQLHNENIEIKTKFNNLDSKYKIMATRVMRLSRDHKCIESLDREEDQQQLHQLRQNEAALHAKLTVLRGQLASHTRLHAAALSKMQPPRSHCCSRSCNAGHSSCGRGGDEELLDTSHPGSRSQSRHCSTSRSTSQQRGGGGGSRGGGKGGVGGGGLGRQKNQKELVMANTALREEVVSLKERIGTLEKETLAASEQSRKRIIELETELGAHLAQETAGNVELIKARRMNKQQEIAMISFQHEYQQMQKELQACKAALILAARDQDEMCSTLMREKQQNTDLQQEIVKLSQTCSSMQEIEEQLNDAKKENAVLKEHSNRLLQLTTGIAEPPASPRSDTNELKRVISSTSNQDQTAILEENSPLKQKLETLKLEQSQLHQELKECQTEIAALRRKILETKEEHIALKDEHIKIQSECSKLRIELADRNEERRKSTQQLADVRSECAHLIEELSKCKSDLEQQQQQHKELLQISQGNSSSSVYKEQTSENNRGRDSIEVVSHRGLASPVPISSRPLYHTPQLSASNSHYMSASQSYSHPRSPRPRFGDACLALLEQTAIRSPSSPFPGVLEAHGSLQERFLELCLPVSSSSIPPATVDEEGNPKAVPSGTQSTPQNPPQVSNGPVELSLMPREGLLPQQSGVQSDTLWELDKCRELLRVQFNLNSIYKKEVASLSNIVQSLTSGTQDASK